METYPKQMTVSFTGLRTVRIPVSAVVDVAPTNAPMNLGDLIKVVGRLTEEQITEMSVPPEFVEFCIGRHPTESCDVLWAKVGARARGWIIEAGDATITVDGVNRGRIIVTDNKTGTTHIISARQNRWLYEYLTTPTDSAIDRIRATRGPSGEWELLTITTGADEYASPVMHVLVDHWADEELFFTHTASAVAGSSNTSLSVSIGQTWGANEELVKPSIGLALSQVPLTKIPDTRLYRAVMPDTGEPILEFDLGEYIGGMRGIFPGSTQSTIAHLLNPDGCRSGVSIPGTLLINQVLDHPCAVVCGERLVSA